MLNNLTCIDYYVFRDQANNFPLEDLLSPLTTIKIWNTDKEKKMRGEHITQGKNREREGSKFGCTAGKNTGAQKIKRFQKTTNIVIIDMIDILARLGKVSENHSSAITVPNRSDAQEETNWGLSAYMLMALSHSRWNLPRLQRRRAEWTPTGSVLMKPPTSVHVGDVIHMEFQT